MTTLSLETIRNEVNINTAHIGIDVPEVAITRLHDTHINGKNIFSYEFIRNGVEYTFLGANFKISGLIGVRIANKETGEIVTSFSIKH